MNSRNLILLLSYFVIILFIIYFFIYLPNKKKHSRQREMHENLKPGDKIVTIGGIVGEVTACDAEYVTILVDKETGTKIQIIVYAVRDVLKNE